MQILSPKRVFPVEEFTLLSGPEHCLEQPGNQGIISALGSYYQQQGNEQKLQELIREHFQ